MKQCSRSNNMKECDSFQAEERDDDLVMCEHCLVQDSKYYCELKEENIVTKTWLPVFPGFYGTWFDGDHMYERELYYIREEIKPEELAEAMCENFFSSSASEKLWKEYKLSVARQSTNLIENELKELGLIESMIFEQVVSPREYNFVNDAIDVTITFTPENVRNIKKFVEKNFDAWKKYLKETYTSYDGFMSFHDNYPESKEWQVDSAIEDCHNSGAILEFICRENGITADTLLDHYYDEVSLDTDMLKKECLDKGWYTPPNFCLDWIRSKVAYFRQFSFRRIRFPKNILQWRLTTPKNAYFFAITREPISNEKNFIFKRFFKVFIFAKIRGKTDENT